MNMKSISLVVVVAAMMATAGCTDMGYNSPGGPGYHDPNYRAPGPSSDERSNRWRQRYSRTYSYADDSYYQQCRNSPDPAGVIAGGLIGGLIGNAAGSGGGRAGATIAGVIIGGAIGAALTSNLDCEDRSYAYKAYYDGFNSERPGSQYQWRNPRNEHRGQLRVDGYDNDPDGFRCANFTQDVYIDGREQEARGRACRQPDGSWTTVN
jgi:surface antigen